MAFRRGETASFDTFFNGFSLLPWRTNCGIGKLTLKLLGAGSFELRLALHGPDGSTKDILDTTIELSENSVSVPIPLGETETQGMLFFRLACLSADGKLSGGAFIADEPPRRVPKLGLVITHFKKKQWVVPAIRRIVDELLEDPRFRGKVELVVVDNSKDLTAEEAAGATLIPNENYGGAGGFTRGLLHLKDRGDFTHCLFMDDDASCEIESLRRAYAYLACTGQDRAAIAGAMLYDEQPHLIHEKGARFWEPLQNGADARDIAALVRSDLDVWNVEYGSWWFFGFALKDVLHFPFPFFVKGDDMLFSAMNRFKIQTLNGVAVWAEDFNLKAGPVPYYLLIRNTSLIRLALGKENSRQISYAINRKFFSCIFSYLYGSSTAIIWALQDLMAGPDFFTEHMDAHRFLPRIAALSALEKHQDISRLLSSADAPRELESGLRRFFRKLTLNGIFIPGIFMRNRTVALEKGRYRGGRASFGYRTVLHYYAPHQKGFLTRRASRRTLPLLCRYLFALSVFNLRFLRLRATYQRSLDRLTGEAFWRGIYQSRD